MITKRRPKQFSDKFYLIAKYKSNLINKFSENQNEVDYFISNLIENITLMIKPDHRLRMTETKGLINTNAMILDKILANFTQQWIKNITHLAQLNC